MKLVQFDADRRRLIDAVRWELGDSRPPAESTETAAEAHEPNPAEQLVEALKRAREGRQFRGRDAVLALGGGELFLQNIRVPKVGQKDELDRLVFREAAGRIPFPVDQAAVRYLEAADVRQGDQVRREVIVLAVHQPVLEERLQILVKSGLRPVAVDVEPTALLRCYARQFRRSEEHQQRAIFVHVGASQTAVIIAEGAHALFIKYLDVGGRHMDQAVAQTVNMDLSSAAALRRHNGDRRKDRRDPEIARSVNEAIRPIIDTMARELSKCVRYHSVTFRGQPLLRLVLGGGEASSHLAEALSSRLDLECELGDPLRHLDGSAPGGRSGQWDVVTGLALREVN